MNLASATYPFELLTDCFCGGADNQGPAEMRVASIRSQIRLWQRAMTSEATVNRVWGTAANGEVSSSKVSLCLDRHQTGDKRSRLLPHSTDPRKQASRSAIPAGTEFTLTLRRLSGCSSADWIAAQKAVKLWLLLGCLGLRCNRAAGSVWPTQNWAPKTETELGTQLRELGCTWPVRLADATLGTTAEVLRKEASDTISGNPTVFGDIKPRTPSPTRMKVIRLGQQYRLLLTAKAAPTLDQAKRLLANNQPQPKNLGKGNWQAVL